MEKKLLWGIALVFLSQGRAFAFDQTHATWTGIIKKYQISDGRLRYAQLKADVVANKDHPLLTYLSQLTAVKKTEYDTWKRDDQMAFLINASNAHTVKLIIDNYPVESIKKIGGIFKKPWGIEFFSLLDGTIKSLDPIEHDILRPKFQDPRVHAAVNCASLSCPRLRPEAFEGVKLETQLQTAFKEFLADPSRNYYDPTKGKLYLSKIFDWFGKDFKSTYGTYLGIVEKLGPPEAAQAIKNGAKVDFVTYNWNLNDDSAPALASIASSTN